MASQTDETDQRRDLGLQNNTPQSGLPGLPDHHQAQFGRRHRPLHPHQFRLHASPAISARGPDVPGRMAGLGPSPHQLRRGPAAFGAGGHFVLRGGFHPLVGAASTNAARSRADQPRCLVGGHHGRPPGLIGGLAMSRNVRAAARSSSTAPAATSWRAISPPAFHHVGRGRRSSTSCPPISAACSRPDRTADGRRWPRSSTISPTICTAAQPAALALEVTPDEARDRAGIPPGRWERDHRETRRAGRHVRSCC